MNNSHQESDWEFDTPLPGELIPSAEALNLIGSLVGKYRKTDPAVVPSNIPTACVLNGEHNDQYLHSSVFTERHRVFVFLEGAGLVHQATPEEVLNYLASRQPWEDYDLCLFDETMEWCVGITHNEQVIVAGQ